MEGLSGRQSAITTHLNPNRLHGRRWTIPLVPVHKTSGYQLLRQELPYCKTWKAGLQDMKQEQKKAENLTKEALRLLPAVQKRSLTLPLPTTKTRLWQQKQKAAYQVQSVVFGEFPVGV